MPKNEAQEALAAHIVQTLTREPFPNQMQEALMNAALRLQARGSIYKRSLK